MRKLIPLLAAPNAIGTIICGALVADGIDKTVPIGETLFFLIVTILMAIATCVLIDMPTRDETIMVTKLRLQILKEVKQKYRKYINEDTDAETPGGLCIEIDKVITKYNISPVPFYLSAPQTVNRTIPLFVFENARMFGAIKDEDGYWWPLSKPGAQQRLFFVDWLITQYEKKLEIL